MSAARDSDSCRRSCLEVGSTPGTWRQVPSRRTASHCARAAALRGRSRSPSHSAACQTMSPALHSDCRVPRGDRVRSVAIALHLAAIAVHREAIAHRLSTTAHDPLAIAHCPHGIVVRSTAIALHLAAIAVHRKAIALRLSTTAHLPLALAELPVAIALRDSHEPRGGRGVRSWGVGGAWLPPHPILFPLSATVHGVAVRRPRRGGQGVRSRARFSASSLACDLSQGWRRELAARGRSLPNVAHPGRQV
jgi:hypothetical protein